MATKREYLASLTPPLAKNPGRGKFSTAAHEALAKAESEGMTFDLTPTEKAALDGSVRRAAKGKADPDAPTEGEPIQKAAARPKPAPKPAPPKSTTTTEPTADNKNYSPEAPRTRQSTTFVGKDGDNEVKVSDKTSCVECGWAFSHCRCFTPNKDGLTGPFLYASKGSTDTLVAFEGV